MMVRLIRRFCRRQFNLMAVTLDVMKEAKKVDPTESGWRLAG